MTDSTNSLQQPVIKKRKKISAIWIIPVVALVFSFYLGYKAYSDRGIDIVVHFKSAEGIVPGKTKVHYKGLVAGVVNRVELDDSLQSVSAYIEMDKRTAPMLGEGTSFWMVRPEVSLSGVSGLETLTSGNYIGFRPSENLNGSFLGEFVALDRAPPLPESVPGLHISFEASQKGSIKTGSKIYYRQIPVGEITSVSLDGLRDGVRFKAHIKEEYQDLVSFKSRFWNASGISISAGLSGVDIKTESLETLLVGGIAFDNMEQLEGHDNAVQKTAFRLFKDFETAQVGLPITLRLPFGSGIDINTPILFEGYPLGKITGYEFELDKKVIVAQASVDPRAEPFLKDDTVFYLVAPIASISEISNLDALVKGRYLSVRPSLEGNVARTFDVLSQAPALDYGEPGLHIRLQTNGAQGLSAGDPIFYRNTEVGSIQQVKLLNQQDGFSIAAHIRPQYKHLVSGSTRFWTSGGITLRGGIQRFELETGSLLSLIKGGIAFDSFEAPQAFESPVENGRVYTLYKDSDAAKFSHKVYIKFPAVDGIKEGVTPILYNGLTVGEVQSLDFGKDPQYLVASVGIDPKLSWSLKDSTQFWIVEPSIAEGNIEAILSGTYITFTPGKGKARSSFDAQINAPILDASASGLQFVVQAESAGSVVRGTEIFYQNIRVGRVQGVELNKTRGGVDIYAHIAAENQSLVKRNSRFYRVSGMTFKGDLSGFKLQTESLSAVLKGGLSFYTPDSEQQSVDAEDKSTFPLYSDIDAARQAGVDIRIRFNSGAGLRENMPIRYQDQKVGEVARIEFTKEMDGVVVHAMLKGEAAVYARQDSRIWIVKPQVGLTRVRNVETLVTGTYLEISPGTGTPTYDFVGIDRKPTEKSLTDGLNLVLKAEHLHSVKENDVISYRQIPIGEVIGVGLASDANGVLIYANIYSEYRSLVKSDSVFWNTSGIHIDAGVFSGVTIDTESVESILSGGISMATPVGSTAQSPAANGAEYQLYDEAEESWRRWKPSISLGQ